jgi:F0F1-type ATP synthase membrane subunit b/b'
MADSDFLQESAGATTPSGGAANALDTVLQEFAATIQEDPGRLRRRPDAMEVLEQVGKGVLVDLSIHRPRFMVRLRPEDLGLSYARLGLASSKELDQYIHLGRRSLLPKELQSELARCEVHARDTLYSFSLDTPWRRLGHFLPAQNYVDWKEANEECEAKFWSLRDRIVAEYPRLVARVLRDYLKLALENWRRLELGSALLKSVPAPGDEEEKAGEEPDEELDVENLNLPVGASLTQDIYQAVLRELQIGQEQELLAAYVRDFLKRTRSKMPTPEAVARAFVYQVELNFVPLPSLVARDLTEADRLFQERTLADAEYRRELARIREQERLELETLREKERLRYEEENAERLHRQRERQLELEKLQRQAELDRLQAQMERDVVARATQEKHRLLDEFTDGITSQINELLWKVCDNILGSLTENEGRLTGSTAMQLNNLVLRLQRMNFSGDQTTEGYINKLRSVLPVNLPVIDSATKRRARLDTEPLSRVLTHLREEADIMLADLGQAPVVRRVPGGGGVGQGASFLFAFEEGADAGGNEVFPVVARRRRNARTPLSDLSVEEGGIVGVRREHGKRTGGKKD